MSGFDNCRTVEARGIAILSPYLKETAYDGRFVLVNKGPLAKHLQETTGDVLWSKDPDRVYGIEIKVEEKHTGNLFLETWSNKNLDNRMDHGEFGTNPGWLCKCRADLLFYYFLGNDHLYIIDMLKLKRWAFGHNGKSRQLERRFREVPQKKTKQKNDTWACLVPVSVLLEEVGYKLVYPKQLELLPEAAA